MRIRLFLLALVACSGPKRPPFAWPKNIEDARAMLLVYIPEGREIAGAREWMAEQRFTCDAPLPSATNAHAHVCRPDASVPADAGFRSWTVVLYERGGRLADVSVRP